MNLITDSWHMTHRGGCREFPVDIPMNVGFHFASLHKQANKTVKRTACLPCLFSVRAAV